MAAVSPPTLPIISTATTKMYHNSLPGSDNCNVDSIFHFGHTEVVTGCELRGKEGNLQKAYHSWP
jgi:hypothetical protein